MEGGANDDKKCEHKYSGEIEGFLTCFHCGLALQENVFEAQEISNHLYSSPKYKINFNVLYELLERGLINKEILEETKILVTNWYNEKKPYKKYQIIYGVFRTAREKDYPLSLREVCDFFGIKVTVMSKMEKIFGEVKNINPLNLINRYCGFFKIPMSTQKKIISKFLHLQKVIYVQDIYLCALCFKIYLPDIDVKSLAYVFKICDANFARYTRVFKTHLIE